MTWVAYVDESMRQRPDGSGLYVLAAAVFDPVDADELRIAVRQLAHGRRPFHWRYEEAADKRKATALVGDLNAVHLVVVGIGLDTSRQERGRRQCMTRLLWELDQAGVGHVWCDARRPKQNAGDLALVAALRARRFLGSTLRLDFAYFAQEPLTWLPDIVAGAVSAARGDSDDQYVGQLGSLLTEYTIELD